MADLEETREGAVVTLTLNRPERLNALSEEMTRLLMQAIGRLGGDAEVGAILLTGAGRGFCSGGDVRGMTSRNVELKSYRRILYGSDADQSRFIEFLLKTAARDRYEFVINFATTDSDRLVARLRPPLADLAVIWAFIGMQTSDLQAKPASAVWDGYLRAKQARLKR